MEDDLMEKLVNIKQTLEYQRGFYDGFNEGYNKALECLRRELEKINICKKQVIEIKGESYRGLKYVE